MNDTEVIAHLSRCFVTAGCALVEVEKDLRKSMNLMVCVGGALNDNLLEYTDKQLNVFRKIFELLENSTYIIKNVKYGNEEQS